MFVYRVGIFGYEESSEVSLVSEIEHSKEEFEKIFLSALKLGFEQEKKEKCGSEDFLEDFEKYTYGREIDYSDIYLRILKILQEDYGLKPLKYNHEVVLWEYLPGTRNGYYKEGFVKEVISLLESLNAEMTVEIKRILKCRSGL